MTLRYKIFQLDKVAVSMQTIYGLVRVDAPSLDKEEDAKKMLEAHMKNHTGQFVILSIYSDQWRLIYVYHRRFTDNEILFYSLKRSKGERIYE